MRFKIMRQGGYASAGLSSAGGTLTGSLILSGNPLQTMEAVNKSYVDGVLSNINATNLTTGTLAVGRMPAFTGDISNPQGTANFTLKASGVSPGSYPKVTVDTKGLVTNGYTLTAADMPPVSWNKITTGKPTTLSGYGITDAVPPGGGTVVGVLSVTSSPTDPLHVVNKSYVDSLSAPTVPNVTGDIIRRFDPVTPAGYLRCNGGLVSKTTYPALYAIIGDTYTPPPAASGVGLGKPWAYQYDINTTQSAALGNWVNDGVAPMAIYSSTAAVTKNRVYVMGGVTVSGSTYTTRTEVYTAPINPDGSLGTWTASTALPGPKSLGGAVVLQNKLYIIGGYSNWSNFTLANNAYVANINSDGTLGAWSTVPAPANSDWTPLLYTRNGKLYCVVTAGGQSVLSSATINGDGSLGTWQVVSTPSGINFITYGCVIGDYLYSLNDYNSSGTYSNQVKRATINADGTLSNFTVVGGTFLSNGYYAQLYITKNRIYAYGVDNFTTSIKTTYSAPINADGSLGSWTAGGLLTKAIAWGTGFAVNNRLYLYAGWDNGAEAVTNTIQYTSITGGVSDYSPYYDPGYQVVDPNNFRLPDYTARELDASYTYIKT